MDRIPKTVFQLDTPFTTTQWPEISSQHQDTILGLLCSLLSPIGHHRRAHVVPSKGKRDKKRKRNEHGAETASDPPLPDIALYVVVGLNAVVKGLETVAKMREVPANKPCPASRFSMVFVSCSTESNMLQSHLPQLIATASKIRSEDQAIRLVRLPKTSISQLSDALALPRVSFIGLLEDAPFSQALVDYVRENVLEVRLPWFQEARIPAYIPVRINPIETFMTITKKREQQRQSQ